MFMSQKNTQPNNTKHPKQQHAGTASNPFHSIHVLPRLHGPRTAGQTASEAKKIPAMGALKPAATPAAAPEASKASGFWLILATTSSGPGGGRGCGAGGGGWMEGGGEVKLGMRWEDAKR